MRRCIALLLLTAAGLAQADVRLSVKPVLCVVDERNRACEMAFVVSWESAERGYYCLYNHFAETPLRCWDDELEGRFDEARTVSRGFQYWLTADTATEPVASVAVEVMSVATRDRRRNRRTRHVWDLN